MADFVLTGERGTPAGWMAALPLSSVFAARPGNVPAVLPGDSPLENAEHCAMLEVRSGGVMVCDLDCRGGMFVNGIAVDFASLHAGDTVRVGDIEVRLELADEVVADTSIAPSSAALDLGDIIEVAGPAVSAVHPTAPSGARPGPPAIRPPAMVARSCDRCDAVGKGPGGASVPAWLCPDCIAAPRKLKLQDPRRIGSFEVVSFLARGGMGAVYEGVARSTGLHVAIKVLLSERQLEQSLVKRFVREQQITETLRHANVTRCVEVGRHEGRLYIASEFLPGGDASKLAGAQSPLAQVLRIGADLFRALAYGHSRGVVHRDIKPANILLTRIGSDGLRHAKLADYGLAKNFRDGATSAITAMGDTGGSISMMSPEQLLDFMSAGPTADLYSGAATLFRLLTGEAPLVLPLPLSKAELVQVASAILDSRRIPLSQLRDDVPGEVAALLDRLVSREPKARAGITADEISGILERHSGELSA